MCKTKAEGGRCAAHLRAQLASAARQLSDCEAKLATIQESRMDNPDDRRGYQANMAAEIAVDDAESKITKLQDEYDSTSTGRAELETEIANTPEGEDRAVLQSRLDKAKNLRQQYRAKAAHADVAAGLRDSDVQHSTISHDEAGATISLPAATWHSHEVSIHADPDQPPESRYTLSVTSAVQEREYGQWDDSDDTPPYMEGRWDRQSAIDHAVSYSRDHMPTQSEVDRANTRNALTWAGIPADLIKGNQDDGGVRVQLSPTDAGYKREIRITPHHDLPGENKFSAVITQSLQDDDGEWTPVEFTPVPGPNGVPTKGFQTRERAVAESAAYAKSQEGWGEQTRPAENDPWAQSTPSPTHHEYDPAPF